MVAAEARARDRGERPHGADVAQRAVFACGASSPQRRPDLIKSNGGGANAILVRGEQIGEHRARAAAPVARTAAWCTRCASASGAWVGNLHATGHPEARAQADVERPRAPLLGWAGTRPSCSAAISTCAIRG